MTEDARFEDASEGPLRLRALDAEDLQVISAAVQDAVFPITEMRWERLRRRFGFLVNRFRWEHGPGNPERVQSMLVIEDVRSVSTLGIDRSDPDTVLSLLSLSWEAGEDGTGRLLATLSGDGAVALDVEALEVTLTDVTRPYEAVSGRVPDHET
ncbi:MAG: DUF2948 family protein [Pseudomonadota bacterium]